MPSMTIEFEVWCAECGEGLCNLTTETTRRGKTGIDVGPCPSCLARAKTEGEESGYSEGEAAGYGSGFDAGLASNQEEVNS